MKRDVTEDDLDHLKDLVDEEERRALCGIIRNFLPVAEERHWNTRGGAWDQCMEASDYFLHELERAGVKGTIEYYDFEGKSCTLEEMHLDIDEYPFPISEMCLNHWAVRVGDVIIDWTARQFDKTASFPAVWAAPERRPWRNCE